MLPILALAPKIRNTWDPKNLKRDSSPEKWGDGFSAHDSQRSDPPTACGGDGVNRLPRGARLACTLTVTTAFTQTVKPCREPPWVGAGLIIEPTRANLKAARSVLEPIKGANLGYVDNGPCHW